MECQKCEHKMEIVQYIQYDDLIEYLNIPILIKSEINYQDWLKCLKAGDLVLTRFIKYNYNKIICKYYLRKVEAINKTGIKLKYLSKLFNYETGELIYEDTKSDNAVKTI